MIRKYRSIYDQDLIIEAVQWQGNNKKEIHENFKNVFVFGVFKSTGSLVFANTISFDEHYCLSANLGDYLIRFDNGQVYVRTEEEFIQSFELESEDKMANKFMNKSKIFRGIKWTGDNYKEVSEFTNKRARLSYYDKEDYIDIEIEEGSYVLLDSNNRIYTRKESDIDGFTISKNGNEITIEPEANITAIQWIGTNFDEIEKLLPSTIVRVPSTDVVTLILVRTNDRPRMWSINLTDYIVFENNTMNHMREDEFKKRYQKEEDPILSKLKNGETLTKEDLENQDGLIKTGPGGY